MKLTSKGRYAVMAMADLAKSNLKKPTSLTEISLRQGISLSFLEQLFLRLKNNNLVRSARGPQGGYVLSKSPEEIKLSSIILFGLNFITVLSSSILATSISDIFIFFFFFNFSRTSTILLFKEI